MSASLADSATLSSGARRSSDSVVVAAANSTVKTMIGSSDPAAAASNGFRGMRLTRKSTIPGSSVATSSVEVGGTTVAHAFHSILNDGDFGLLVSSGEGTFDDVLIETDDPAYADNAPETLIAAQSAGEISVSTTALVDEDVDAVIDEAITRLAIGLSLDPAAVAALQATTVTFADLPDLQLGISDGSSIVLDIDGAGHGWFVDTTPGDDLDLEDTNV